MVRKLSAQQARDNFGELISSVYFTKEPIIVEKRGKPYAVLVSPEAYEIIRAQEAQRAWAEIHHLREANKHFDPDDVLRDVTEEVEAVRAELFAETEHADSGNG